MIFRSFYSGLVIFNFFTCFVKCIKLILVIFLGGVALAEWFDAGPDATEAADRIWNRSRRLRISDVYSHWYATIQVFLNLLLLDWLVVRFCRWNFVFLVLNLSIYVFMVFRCRWSEFDGGESRIYAWAVSQWRFGTTSEYMINKNMVLRFGTIYSFTYL